jgi:tetratricopeptide (TPR) repeat protein
MRAAAHRHLLRVASGLVLTLLWVGLPSRAEAPRFSLSQFAPSGPAGKKLLLGAEPPDPAAIASAVAQRGFYAGEPLSATECSGCHAEIAAQWAQSAHRFSSFNNPYYAASVDQFRKERPLQAARFCAGCHDPLLLIDDAISAKELLRDIPAAQAGLPCLICHSTHEARPGEHPGNLGNGAYTLRIAEIPPPRDSTDSRPGPSLHGQRLRPPVMSRPELCASCHRVALTADITHDTWLRGQDDYGPWLASVAAGNGVGAVYRPDKVEVKRCQDCHMPLEPLKSGKLVRSHRFLGANAALPNLRQDPDAIRRTTEFLQGAVSIDVLVLPQSTGSTGAVGSDAAPLLDDRVVVSRKGPLHFDVVLRNRRVGHRFPGGTNDSNDVWVEVSIAPTGTAGGGGSLRDDTHLVRGQPVDKDGEPLLRRDPQNMRGVVYNTSLSPADPQVVRYAARLDELPPGKDVTSLELVATLRYRKFSRDYAAFACKSLPAIDAATRARCLEPPVIDVAVARRQLLFKEGAGPPKPRSTTADDWQRYLDHGLGLADGLVDEASAARPSLLAAMKLAPSRAEPRLGLMRLALALGRTEEVLSEGARAEVLRKDHPAHLYLRGLALYRTYKFREARPFFERAALLVPRDPNLLAMLARVRGLDGDPTMALHAADRLLAIEPESEDGHHQRMLALRELNRKTLAQAAEQRYLLHRRPVEVDQDLRQLFRARHPERAQEDVPAHLHVLRPNPRRAASDILTVPSRHP